MNLSTIDKSQGIGRSGTNPFLKGQFPVKRLKLDKFILAQVAWCTFPALILVRLGALTAGSTWCFVFLLAFLTRYVLRRNMPAFVALTLAVLPALAYTRLHFFYNSVVVLLGLGLGLWLLHSPKECARLWDNKLIRWFFIAGTVYWILSVLVTRQYSVNLMVMEMLCSAGSIYLLAKYPRYLATALAGLGISIFSITIGMLGMGDRLGVTQIEGENVGNNQMIALPAALLLILTLADNGKWLFLQHSKIVKNGLIVMSGVLLLLSTSRASWGLALVGIVVAAFYQSRNRRKIFTAFILSAVVLMGILQTESGEKVSQYFEMATDSESTLTQKTTGRFDMWVLLPRILADSPIWGVGPGLGRKAYADYSWEEREVTFRKGKEIAWHALYLHVGVETGTIGLTVLTLLLGTLMFKTFIYQKLTGQVIPLIGIVGYMIIGFSVPALDSISGLFLGLAFLGTGSPPRKFERAASMDSRNSKMMGAI